VQHPIRRCGGARIVHYRREVDDVSPEGPGRAIDRRAPDPRRTLPLLIGPIIVMIVMTNLGNIFFAQLVNDRAGLLLLLNSQNRYLALATNHLDPLPYYGIGMFRLLLPDPFFYLLGFWYGESVLSWVESKSETYGGTLRMLETWFDKASWVIVAVFPNNYVCLIAGTARMSPILFAILDVVGTAGRLVLFRIFGQAFADQLDSITTFIGNYRWPLTALSFALVAIVVIRDYRAGTGQIEQLRDLEEEITRDASADEAADDG
jgi:membrane protein DedA with SNARE-associated domain